MKPKRNIAVIVLVALLAVFPLTASAGNPFEKIGDVVGGAAGAISGFGKSLLGLPGDIAGAIGNAIGNILINLIFQVPLAITATFWLLVAGLVKWVLSPEFLGIPITSTDNAAVYEMWQLVRDFTNMFFVLALVAIGLGTALRYGEYQLQRALPRLILIAFLINFTPVIVGFFIDAANITIRFLVSETAGENLLQMAKKAYDGNINLFTSVFTDSAYENLAAATAQLIFNVIATIVYFLFFILFFFRYVALNILFILSPLAFFSFILPATRGFWNRWWSQFISWLIVGISGAFFIMLAGQMVGVMWDVDVDVGSGIFKGFTEFINIFVVAITPIAFLVLGFMFTLQTSAMGASVAIAIGQRTYRWAGRQGAEVIRGTPVGQRVERGVRQRLERAPLIGGAFGGPGAYEARVAQERGALRARLEHMAPEDLRRRIERTPMTRTGRLERAAALEVLAEKNQLRETERPYLREMQMWGIDTSRILDKMPHWAGDVAPAGVTPEQAIRQRILDMEPENFRKNIRAHVFAPPPPGAPPDTLARQIDVLAGMDMQKTIDLGRRGRRSTREALYNFVTTRQNEILNEVTRLQNLGRPDEAQRLFDVAHHILNSPNYIP